MHNNIYCAGGRMCAKENTPHYLQKAAQWKNNALSSSKQRHLFTKNTPSFFKITAYFFQGNEQADYQQLHIPADTRSAFPVISVQSPVSIQCCWQS